MQLSFSFPAEVKPDEETKTGYDSREGQMLGFWMMPDLIVVPRKRQASLISLWTKIGLQYGEQLPLRSHMTLVGVIAWSMIVTCDL